MSEASTSLPEGLLVSWYGDDFTGSSAVMEVLTLAGLPSVLFLDTPTPELLAQFSNYHGRGIAGIARSKTPAWMDANLPGIFSLLSEWSAPVTHYKICSTLDSSLQIGSIGKAIEIAAGQFCQSRWIPLVVAAPAIKRYQLFANLFVGDARSVSRLDRHPSMSRHPVTPMTEADVRVHLSTQTTMQIGLVDFPSLREGGGQAVLASELAAGRRIVALDVMDDATLVEVGRLIWEQRGRQLFAVGSQGIEYALVAYWRSCGLLPEITPPRASAVDRIAIVSGSCSPVTNAQIAWAESHGFHSIRIDARLAVDDRAWNDAVEEATRLAIAAIDAGRDPIVFSARGPDDPAVRAFQDALETSGSDLGEVTEVIGRGLGKVLKAIFDRTNIRRGVLAGGDTSGYGAKTLGIDALTLAAPTVPGAALFRAHSIDPAMAHLEIALKGGQMGAPDYFSQIKNGGGISI